MMHENDAAEILCNLCFNEYMKKALLVKERLNLQVQLMDCLK